MTTRPHFSSAPGAVGASPTKRTVANRWSSILVCCLLWAARVEVPAATVPAGFTETDVVGPWSDAVGTAFEDNGRIYVWERTGKVWFKDPGDFSYTLLLDISPEVGTWEDHGMLGFALDPEFRVNGNIYLLYVVDRHYLLNFGTGSYNPSANQYNAATIGRVTRYTCTSSSGFRSVDLSSRVILIGETKQTGFPILSYTHGIGSLVFGQDGTLLVTCGDGATADTVDPGGTVSGSYAPQGLSDGIIRAKENIGAYRSQLLDCLNGKVVRIDPATGNGVPTNPYYDAANPRSARSRVWVLGLRNPFRMMLKPESGSHNPADGNPGVLYVGDVGWGTWEMLRVVTGPKQNFGWPLFEGLSLTPGYDGDVSNLDAPNPLYPAGGCNQYFTFADLLKEDTLAAAGQPPFNNPCNTSQKIPSSIPQFLHTRPVLDWNHSSAITRTPTYDGSGQAQIASVGAGGSPVSGTQFQGNCAVGGTWYTGTNFPPAYQNRYYFADWGSGVIKSLTFDANDRPIALGNFASAAGQVVSVVQHPTDGSLYYISYNFAGSTIQQLVYTGNRTPIAAASADKYYGPSPLAVQLSSSGSSDPDEQPITYSWNFGDGSPVSTQANPAHSFTAPPGVPTKYVVTFTVTDSGGLSAQTTLIVSVNNTPPNVTITSPVDGALYSSSNSTTVNLTASVSDTESSDSQLLYQWQTLLHHNNHNHGNLPDTNHVTTAVISPTGCDGINIYYYRILLTVTDPAGLATTREVRLYPDCGPNTAPVISAITNRTILQNGSTGPINFTVGDAEMVPENLQLSGTSSNPALVPVENIVFGGSGSNRTVTVTPAVGLTGSATITVTVNDGPHDTSTSFVLSVIPSVTANGSFTNVAPITIPSQGAGTPYPSTINVTGMGGPVTNITVTLRALTHAWANDIDVLLVGPGGQKVMLMSDAGIGGINNANLTFSDGAAGTLAETGSVISGTYKPTDYAPADTFSSPAPAGPYGTALSAFTGEVANGVWSLYVFDDGAGDQGSIAGGWSLTLAALLAGGSAAPTISDIPDQLTTINTPTTAIPFTIADSDTPVENLTLSRSSSNSTLVPTNNIVFGGSGSNRTVTVTPAAGQTGTATITVTVSDGTNSASDAFVLTVNAVNTPPTITDIADATVNEDTSTAALGFTVGDAETAAGSLTLTKASSNPALVPVNNIVFGGSGGNRTVTVTPATDQNGVATITVTVSDGQYSVSTNFVVTVNAVNDPPTITGIANQTINVNGTAGPLSFTIADVDTAAASLTLSAGSSNPTLVPTNNIVFGGSGNNRTVTVTPAAGQSGTATITIIVSDGQYNASTGFVVTVSTLFAGTKAFTNAAAITIPDQGAATPYPSTISVTGMGGTISNVTVTLTSLSHTWKSDVDVLLVSPSGQKVVVMSDAGDIYTASGSVTITLSDSAAANLPAATALSSGTFKPTDYAPADTFPSPAPAGPYGTNLAGFNGQSANGTWSLYVVDDGAGDQGSIAGGWTLTVTTVSSSGAPPTISDIADQTTTVSTPTAAIPFTIADADTPVANLTLSAGSANPTLVPTSNIVFGGSGNNRTVTVTPATGQTGTATVTITVSDGVNSASDAFVLTVNAVNTAPTITGIANQTIDEDTGTGALNFTVGDEETAPGSLILAKGSSNPTLVPTNNIIFGGSGANRTVTVTPAANQNGTATITVTVSDGQYNATTNFVLTVNALNDPPTITGIADQTINIDATTGPLSFTIGDVDTAVASLTLNANSSNPTLVPISNIVFGGSGSNRTVTVTPETNQTGTATITLTVSDGQLSASDSFVLTVSSLITGTKSFTNATAITIPSLGIASPYPSTINGAGMAGTVSNVTVTLYGITHARMRDIDILLVGPTGQKVIVLSDVGPNGAVNNITLTLSDAAASSLGTGTIVSGTYKPTNITTGDTFASPAPAAPYGTTMSALNGTGANGTWSLYVVDDSSGSTGRIAGGWSITLTTANARPTITGIADQSIAVNGTAGPLNFIVGDLDTPLANLTLTGGSSNPTLVPTNNIVFGGSGSNRTVTVTPAANQTGTATITVTVSDGVSSANDTFLLTVNAVNAAPTISSIANQTVNEDTATAAVGFTVGDAETAPGSLTLSGNSSNLTLVPSGNIVFGGSGANRTVTVTPAANQSGTATIAVSVSDGQLSTSTNFVVTVNALNDPPVISNIGDQSTSVNTATTAIPFTIGDVDTAVTSLTLSRGSSNPTLVPTNNIVFGGSGSNRTVTVTPAANQTGTATITVTVSDGASSASDTFVLTVFANGAPTIGPIADQVVFVDQPTIIKLELSDAETAVTNLQLSLVTTDTNLIRGEDYLFRYFFVDGHRYLTMAGAFGLTGKATNTVTVSDGTNSASTSFVITVIPPPPGAARFANTSPITIPSGGPASLYPSTINVSGMSGSITNLNLTVSRFAHEFTDDVAMLLVGPTGVKVVIFSRVGSGNLVTNVTFTLSDTASYPLPPSFPLWSEVFTPNNYASSNFFPAPAPVGPYASTASFTNYNGLSANGNWSLYVYDRGTPDQGSIAGGWSLMIATAAGANQSPTISDIPNQLTTVNTATAAIPFTIGDPDTAVGSLTLSRGSSNPTLVPTNNIVFGGSGSNRTVTVTPAANQTGTATITVTVSDGTNSASDTFLLTVNAVNTAPTISSIADQTVNEDTATAAVGFTVGDAETTPGSLTLSGISSNLTLVPSGNIVFGGSGANRTVTVTPAANQIGTATIAVSVSDGQYTASTNFVVTVNAVNDAPTISGIPNQTINVNGTSGPLGFTIGDVDTAVTSLTLSSNSSNPTLVPLGNIVFGGSGSSRTVTVTPAANQTGTSTITVGVSDGQAATNTSFLVTVSSLFVGTRAFTNAAAITIPDAGAGTPYPSTINVSGMGGTISDLTVTLRALSHTWGDDINVLLVGPDGEKATLMSDAGTGGINAANLTFSDGAAGVLPQTGSLVSGTYKPTDYGPTDTYPAPAPAGPYGTNLTAFNGTAPNGTWSLYSYDDGPGDQGSFATGWSITVTTIGAAEGLASAAVSFVPVEYPPVINAMTLDDRKAVLLTVSGKAGLSYALEASSDLVNWTKVAVQDNTTGSIVFKDEPTTNAIRFYRVVSTLK